jgi:ribosomal protein L3 glutamine methyltransferase
MNHSKYSIDKLSLELSTILDWVRFCASELTRNEVFLGHGTDNPWDEAAQLVTQALALPSDLPHQYIEAKLIREEKEQVLTWLEQRVVDRTPLPYLTNRAHWAGLEFYVNEDVLIPRSPIFELIESGFEQLIPKEPERILDMCTGSGCIAIALAMHFQESEVDASDISTKALTVAAQNIQAYQLDDQICLFESDGFETLSEAPYDLIVTNPPYVDQLDMESMPTEFGHEPALALESGEDGLDFTRDFLKKAANHLTEQGVVIVEVGNSRWALEAAYPEVDFHWIEFQRGGHGVFLLTKQQIEAITQ